ncbi:LysR family transcriptional regulator [Pseudomonas sp. OTU5201]|uniref:LysR family transcriptional regulator n=1 Tax=Pseudomonas sp. OTU5201 TaxID=3043850 RepID=UPI00313F0E93
MKLHQIKALVAIHRTGSLNEASQILHVTQPALSRSIKDLERELGLTLLQRSYKGMSLTEEGRRVIRHAQLAVESLRRLQIEAENIQAMTVGEISIGVTSLTAMLDGLEESLTVFQTKNPRVRLKLVDLRPSQILQRLRDGTLDFAITSQQNTQRLNLDWETLNRIRGVVVCSADNPLRHSRSLRQLQYASWLSLDEIDDRSSQFYQMFEVNDIHAPQRIIECSSVMLALRLLRRGEAFMTLSKLGLANVMPSALNTDLVQVKVEEIIPEYPIYLVCIDRHSLTSPARDLFYSLKARLAVSEPALPQV